MSYDRREVKSMNIDELKGFIPTKMAELVEMAGEKSEKLKSLTPEGVEDFTARNEELKEARVRFSSLRAAAKSMEEQQTEHNKDFKTADRKGIKFQREEGDPGADRRDVEYKTLGEMFTESDSYKRIHDKGAAADGTCVKGGWDPQVDGNCSADIGSISIKSLAESAIKATMVTSSGWAPFPQLAPRPPVLTAMQQPTVADLIPQDDVSVPSINYYEETTFDENAQFVAEGATKPEAGLGLTLRTQAVVKIAVTLPISEEQIMDVPQVRSYIDSRLTLMVKRKEEFGLLDGTGVSPQLRGFHNVENIGSITKQALEDNPDAILRAITDVNQIEGYANASGIVLNPQQWMAIRLLRTKTGEYIWGHPALVGPATLWGLPVIPTNAEAVGRALVGDFVGYSHISRRMGIRIDVGYIDKDFVNDIQRIRLEERLSLEVYRAKAFEEVLGLDSAQAGA